MSFKQQLVVAHRKTGLVRCILRSDLGWKHGTTTEWLSPDKETAALDSAQRTLTICPSNSCRLFDADH